MSRGHDRERAVRRELEKDGWWTARAAGSLGDADVVALRRDQAPMLVEVKSTADGPYKTFGPADRTALLEAADRAGAVAYLAWWPPRGRLQWIPSSEWPRARKAAA